MLRYFFPPREMWLFGASTEERVAIKARCVSEIEFQSFEEAMNSLKSAYRARQVVTR